ncbi:ABC transporter substrate-binding protein [Glutamicibacter sp.]|uniref:ABC transporter substrate-binding protein n=1 Tax=Glutamicibacter sp. TaxID=1931995 RepID=UPI002B45DC70|nr:iron-siderophore ABC transporter substrate-binding protein [Glutamicibacter sp.]HJX79282.1 iron-siderophore ABC transporter substrate-binding protein [Glutamicibacter sp.]
MIAKRNRSFATLAALTAASIAALTGCASSATGTVAESSSPESATYSVEHAMGTTEIKGKPERIVVIDSPHLDALTALDIIPVGATESGASQGFPAYLQLPEGKTTSVGLTMEPSVDEIANLKPDLIIGAKVRHEAIYKELSAVAPTVFSVDSGTNWQEQARVTAAAVGESAKMEELISALDERAAQVGEEVNANGTTASIVRFRPDNFRLYGPESFSGSILSSAGFDLGTEGWNEYSMKELSPEQYEQIDGDLVFFTNPDGDPKATTMEKVTGLWASLDPVKNNDVHEVSDETWMVGIGVVGANQILDDVQKLLKR